MASKSGVPEVANVLVSFAVENVRSYRERTELTLLAGRTRTESFVQQVWLEPSDQTIDVLRSAGVFGANASGKSALLFALDDLRDMVLDSFRVGGPDTTIPRRPFRLNETSPSQPSIFEIELVLDNVRWQYGCSITDQRVVSEYAYHFPNGRQALVFDREGADIRLGAPMRSLKSSLLPIVRPNALLLSAAGAIAENPLTSLFTWFQRNLWLAETGTRGLRAARTAQMLEDQAQRQRVLGLLQAADLGLVDIKRREPHPDFVEKVRSLVSELNGTQTAADTDDHDVRVDDLLQMVHQGANGPVEFDQFDESVGTLVWVALIGPVLDALDGGKVLMADELDASLHPHLVQQLVDLFQSPDTNPRCAQLLFNAHDVTVLGDSEQRCLGRDQIWLTEKDNHGASSLTPLSDYRVRNDEALERRYLQGRYGGVPVLDVAGFRRSAQPAPS